MDGPKFNPSSPERQSRAGSPALEIKRSSWHAGMSSNPALPPPGSPAAWQERRKSRPLRPHSPSKYLNVPLETIRSVSGSGLDTTDCAHLNEHSEQSEHSHNHPQNHPHDHAHSQTHDHSEHTSAESHQAQKEVLSSPFQFTPTYINPGKPAPRPRASQRRGHHYKHSSVSLNFFQEPEQRAPLAIPVSLAVPTFSEYWQSITRPQFARLAWCGVRMAIAFTMYTVGSPVHSVAPLAHLLAYETVVSTTAALVGILANFDVWNKSSLRLPFALKRAEALVAFGLAAMLLFIGGDVLSHLIQHLVQPHTHEHEHEHVSATSHYLIVLVSLFSIVPSALRQRTSNPLALITALIACVVLVVPALPQPLSQLVDSLLNPVIALTMISVGWTSAKLFGGMLVMSYGGPDRSSSIAKQICEDPSVEEASDVSLWQVHHDLWLASMRIIMRGSTADERRVRDLAGKALKTAVDVDADWETTIEITNVAK